MANAIWFDILEQVRTDIVALALPDLADANVVVRKVPTTRLKDLPEGRFPCVQIAPWGVDSVTASSNLRDDIGYPVLVAIMASEADDAEQPESEQTRLLEMYLKWRETIRKSFSNQRLTTTLCWQVTVEPLPVTDRESWFERGLWISGMVLRCINRESRG